ncbi:MAG: CcoQ/FixQ family Cbb3-type cytochrome c oxidase assembly chaperone [Betaproteobacteria bacterium]|nr:CcoQ/FixQ family Cbb3-type cytochrome c oxidase assembly chaperone [Betaproteobacteria bacterium]
MDLNDIRGVLTPLLGIILFLCIVRWAYSKRSAHVYEEAANLPFMDDDDSAPGESGAAEQRKMI